MGIALIFVSELFPHWYYEDNNTSAKRTAGYHLVTTPPSKKGKDELTALFAYTNGNPPYFPGSVDLKKNRARQELQEIVITLFTLALCILVKTNPSRKSRTIGIVVLLFGLPVLAFLILEVSIRGV
jgi:hypothetical protein